MATNSAEFRMGQGGQTSSSAPSSTAESTPIRTPLPPPLPPEWGNYGSGTVMLQRKVNRPVDLVITVLLPWLIFTLVTCLFSFAYEEFGALIWALVAAAFLLAFLVVMLGLSMDRSSPSRAAQLVLGVLIIVCVGCAIPIGLSIEDNKMKEYWRLDNGATYQQVNPRDYGSRHLDASVIKFQLKTYVDLSRTQGYRKNGDVYCVAPVVPSKGVNESPQFWAAGQNCCQHKGSDHVLKGEFSCGDVKDKKALTGLVFPDSDHNRKYYKSAVRMAQSTYGFEASNSEPVLMRWTSDAENYKDSLWSSAALYVSIASCVDLVISLMVGFLLSRTLLKF